MTENREGARPRSRKESGPVPRDEGSGTVLSVGLCLAVITMILTVLALAQAAVGAARAGTAADLAALAAADTIRALRPGEPCTIAGEIAARNGAELAGCTPDPGSLSVTVEVRAGPLDGLPWAATATARAGPPG